MRSVKKKLLAGLFCLPALFSIPFGATASHIVGADMTYKYIKDTTIGGITHKKYEVTLMIYQDCVKGQPDAISQDNPAFFTAYNNGIVFKVDTNIFYDATPGSGGSITVPIDNISTPCGSVSLQNVKLCLLRKKFSRNYYLPPSDKEYTIVYQRCCRNSSISNLTDPGDNGSTYYCTIPATATNNSAVFGDYPAQVVCLGLPMNLPFAATDADGDSLSYEFAPAFDGASGPDIKPKIATPPPYDMALYAAPYTYNYPISSAADPVRIDATTGTITGSPDKVGRYIMVVVCKEWRNGVKVNESRREFQWTVMNCSEELAVYKPNAGPDVIVLTGETIQFDAKGAAKYVWEPATGLSNANIANPTALFTEPGEYVYMLRGESDKGCTGTDEIKVHVLEHSDFTAPNAFTPNGDGHNDKLYPIPIGKSKLVSFKIFDRWGNEVFQTPGLQTSGWDGTYKGTAQPQAVYVWSIEYIDNFEEKHTKGGNTTLLR